MQTFLPFQSFEQSARSIDKKRCWKQVVEAKQILCVLRYDGVPQNWKESKGWIKQGWRNHPAVLMWKGYENALASYYNEFLDHCIKFHLINTSMESLTLVDRPTYPWWLGDENFHRAMRARLIVKDRNFYLSKFPNDEGFNNGMYWWPDMKTRTFKTI